MRAQGVHTAPNGQLSPMLLHVLHLAAGATNDDVARWRHDVLAVARHYDDAQMDRAYRELAERGYITDNGSPYTGWLTLKGKRTIEEAGPIALREAPNVIIERTFPAAAAPQHPPLLPFKQFDQNVRRDYWKNVLLKTRGNVRRAAVMAGLCRKSVYCHLRSLDLNPRDFKRPS